MSNSAPVETGYPVDLPHFDAYHLLQVLGEGGSGTVFKALQKNTGKTVALKLLRAGQQRNDEQLRRMEARFEREAHLGAQLHHPHIVGLLDKGKSASQQHFAVFEYVPGETLKQFLVRKGALSAVEAGDLMGQVLDALACAHAQGIAHRDLKPQNIMLTATGTRQHVKILDFGIAAFVPEQQSPDYRQLTMTSEMLCSPSYSAPEHLRGEAPTVKIDLYAWGLLFIECLTGRPAIEGATLADIFHQQLSSGEVPLPHALLGHPLGDLLRRALKKDPRQRAHSASALYQDFKRINLATIVGQLDGQRLSPGPDLPAGSAPTTDASETRQYVPGQMGLAYQRQQLTVLSCTLDVLTTTPAGTADIEALEALQRDQLSACIDTATRYGGHLAGGLGNSLLFYFGYPRNAEDDARRCARAALELSSQLRRRNSLLQAQGFRVDLRAAIHTGIVHILPGHLPAGVTPNTAMQLERRAARGEVLVSDTARQLLMPHVHFKHAGEHIDRNDGATLPYFSMLGEHEANESFMLRSGQNSRPLVGREEELAVLERAWLQVRRGRGQALLLQGDAGIGKSRLAYALCAQIRQQGALVVDVRCVPEHQNNALHAILALLDKRLFLRGVPAQLAVQRVQQALEQAGIDLASVLPILCAWLALPLPAQFPALPFSPERQKNLLLDALCSLLLQLGRGKPFLFLVEDVHWIDQTGQDLLGRMLARLEPHPVFLLMTARASFAKPWITLQRMQLAHLSEPAAGQLVRAMLGAHPIDGADLRRLCLHTDGVPLFIVELTRMLLDKGMLRERDGVYQLHAQLDGHDIPVTLRDLLSARLARLAAAQETAQLAAAIGREFDYAMLLEVTLIDEASLQADLEQLIAADLVSRQCGVQGDTYLFCHALIRDAAYDGMPKKMREQTHARIAAHLERRGPDDIERQLAPLAQHFALALQYGKAVDYGTRSGRLLLQRSLADDAVRQCEMVLGLIGKLDKDAQEPAELGINPILTNAYMSKFGWADERVKQLAEHALRLVDNSNNVHQTLPLLWGLAAYHHCAGHRQAARGVIGQLYALAHQSGDRAILLACHAIDGITLWVDGEYLRAREALQQVLQQEAAPRDANQIDIAGLDARVWAMAGMSCLNWFMLEDEQAAFEQASAAVAYARAIKHMPSLGVALMYQAYNYHYAGDCENAMKVSGEMLELAQRYGLPAIEGYGAILHAWSRSDLAMADQVLSQLRQLGLMLGLTCLGAVPAEIEARAGNYAQACQRIDACLALSVQTGEHYFDPELLLRRAIYRSHCKLADPEQSRADLRQAITLAHRTGMRRCEQRARAQLDLYA